jgi:hypothetical protein
MLHPVIVFPNPLQAPDEPAVCTDFGAARGRGGSLPGRNQKKNFAPLFRHLIACVDF